MYSLKKKTEKWGKNPSNINYILFFQIYATLGQRAHQILK